MIASAAVVVDEAVIPENISLKSPLIWQVPLYLDRANLVFQLIFAAELAVNLYAHWFWPFTRDLWLVFDFLVVSLSLVGLAPMRLPLKLILLCRCAASSAPSAASRPSGASSRPSPAPSSPSSAPSS